MAVGTVSLITGLVSLIASGASAGASASRGKKAVEAQNQLLSKQSKLLEKGAQHGRDIKGRELDRAESASRFNKSLFNKQT